MAYNEITNRNSPNFWAGGNTIKGITIHWWGDPSTNPSAEGVVNWLCNPASQVSAHFVITGTGRRVWQLVADKDRAWHAMSGNQSTIGLELDPRCRDEDYDVAAEVIADLWRYYGKLPLYPHKHWVNTACPGNYDLARLQREAEAKLNPKPVTPPAPVTKPVPAAVKLPKKLEFTADKDKVEVWDLTTNPNYKSVKTLTRGEKFAAYGSIEFNGVTYYVTEYSFNKGSKHGINSIDLKAVELPKPIEPEKPVEPEKPIEPVLPPISWDEQNNSLLVKLVDMVQWIIDKIKTIFK